MTNLLIKLFVKNSDDTTSNIAREKYTTFAGIVGICSNILAFALKIAIGLLSGAISIIADALNNLTDSLSAIITIIGAKLSNKKPDMDHPYGHGRIEYITELILSFIIIFFGIELAKSSFNEILNPKTPVFSVITIIVLLFSIFLKLWQGFFYIKISKKINSGTLKATSKDSFNDVLTTSGVLICVIFTYFTHIVIDGYVGLLVALFIIYGAIMLIKQTLSSLMGEAPDKEFVENIANKILSYDKVTGVHDLIVHNYGPGRLFASVHVEMDAKLDPLISHDLIDNIEKDFINELNIPLVIHYDPVEIDNPFVNETKAKIKDIAAKINEKLSIHDLRIVLGKTHTNIIFDVCLPDSINMTPSEVTNAFNEEIKKIDESYNAVITVDYCYE